MLLIDLDDIHEWALQVGLFSVLLRYIIAKSNIARVVSWSPRVYVCSPGELLYCSFLLDNVSRVPLTRSLCGSVSTFFYFLLSSLFFIIFRSAQQRAVIVKINSVIKFVVKNYYTSSEKLYFLYLWCYTYAIYKMYLLLIRSTQKHYFRKFYYYEFCILSP